MSAHAAPRPTFAWWVILCLVGLDYFSTLAYLPSIAVSQMMRFSIPALAPLAAVGVVLVTLLAALPVYWYVVGRSPQGKGGIGLLEQRAHGWHGKVLILVLLGFVATDYVMTRSLSVSDAATHLLGNPIYQDRAEWVENNREMVRGWLPQVLQGRFFDFWNEQLLLTVILSILAFGLYFFLVRSISRGFLGVAVGVVGLYVVVNLIVISSGLIYIHQHPNLLRDWEEALRPEIGDFRSEAGNVLIFVLLFALLAFPSMAIGLSGFELSMASAPLVNGSPTDHHEHPRSRIRKTRFLMVVAALIMCVLVLSSVFVVTLLVPREAIVQGGVVPSRTATAGIAGGVAAPPAVVKGEVVQHRALAYLAHGERLADRAILSDSNPILGGFFGTIYDLSTILILCLAGASATISMRELVPDFLARFGMQMVWAHKIDVITHLFNVVILLVAVWFRASVTDQLWAYAASVLALLFGASLAAALDVRQRWRGPLGLVLQIPFGLITLLFAVMGVLIIVQGYSGIGIPLLFVVVVLFTAIVSRWRRSTELRFVGFDFADEATKQRWEEICKLEFQVLVPHDPAHGSLADKEERMRKRHRLGPDVPIIFIEAYLGDPSDFFQNPLMQIEHINGAEVVRVRRCTSIAHVIAAIGLAFREVGQPPEIHFTWSNESPMAANLHFLLLGQGNVPWMVHELMLKAEPDTARRPQVMVG
jgi:hypothetical protein